MTINDFAKLIAKREGKKKQVDIAQIKEILKITRELLKEALDFDLYSNIRYM